MKPLVRVMMGGLLAAGLVGPVRGETVVLPLVEGDWRVIGSLAQGGAEWDFAVWRDGAGAWRVGTTVGRAVEGGLALQGWVGAGLGASSWEPGEVLLRGEADWGAGLRGLHVVESAGRHAMAFGIGEGIRLAVGDDGVAFTVQPGVISEGRFAGARDPMMAEIGGRWHLYYTVTAGGRGYLYCRFLDGFARWSPSAFVSYGGSGLDGALWNQGPQVVEVLDGELVYMAGVVGGERDVTRAYYSRYPYNFGVDNNEGLVAELDIARARVINDEGVWHVAALTEGRDGVRLARLRWARRAVMGEPVFDFDDPQGRAKFRMVEGDFDAVFFTETHVPLGGVTEHVIATTEQHAGGYDDTRTGVIESEPFRLDEPYYTLLVGGGRDIERVYVAIVDAQTGEEVARFGGRDANRMQTVGFTTGEHEGREVFVRVVDQSTGPWGHINFGGIYRPGVPEIFQ
jgi:hypothetical protein